MSVGVAVDKRKLADFCQRHHIRRLSFFGSVLRPDFRADSDIDVLAEFEAGHVPGLRLISIQRELSELLGGRRVELITPKFLNHRIRADVLSSAELQYVKG